MPRVRPPPRLRHAGVEGRKEPAGHRQVSPDLPRLFHPLLEVAGGQVDDPDTGCHKHYVPGPSGRTGPTSAGAGPYEHGANRCQTELGTCLIQGDPPVGFDSQRRDEARLYVNRHLPSFRGSLDPPPPAGLFYVVASRPGGPLKGTFVGVLAVPGPDEDLPSTISLVPPAPAASRNYPKTPQNRPAGPPVICGGPAGRPRNVAHQGGHDARQAAE
jgi:hypothetical protein